MLLVVKLSRTFLVTWLWWGGAHWIWRLQLFSPLHHNIIMHILHKGFSICFLKWWQGECASQSRESLVGDHFLYSCDLYVWCRGITVRRNSVLVTPRDQRVSFLISLNYHTTYIVVLVWRVSEYIKKKVSPYIIREVMWLIFTLWVSWLSMLGFPYGDNCSAKSYGKIKIIYITH